MPTFAEIQDEIGGMLDLTDEELTQEQKDALDAYLEELGGMEAEKVDSFAQFVRLSLASADACDAEAKRLAAKARATRRRIESLKDHYLAVMHQHDLRKVTGATYTISVRESSAVVVTAQPGVLPDFYMRRKVVEEPDKALIRESLKDGVEVPGAELVRTYSLQVR